MVRWLLATFGFAALPLLMTWILADILAVDATVQLVSEILVFCLVVNLALLDQELSRIKTHERSQEFVLMFIISAIVSATGYAAVALSQSMKVSVKSPAWQLWSFFVLVLASAVLCQASAEKRKIGNV